MSIMFKRLFLSYYLKHFSFSKPDILTFEDYAMSSVGKGAITETISCIPYDKDLIEILIKT